MTYDIGHDIEAYRKQPPYSHIRVTIVISQQPLLFSVMLIDHCDIGVDLDTMSSLLTKLLFAWVFYYCRAVSVRHSYRRGQWHYADLRNADLRLAPRRNRLSAPFSIHCLCLMSVILVKLNTLFINMVLLAPFSYM